jgi:GTP-binding protein
MPGGPGEQRRLVLELKLIADVGIIGFPNAGKSSLLSRISAAHPKVAAYPFTTRYPVLGVVDMEGRGSFVACDIPGLIEGAHAGKGLGMQFLRHIERTRLLLHVIDMAAVDGHDPLKAFHQVNHELTVYSEALAQRPQLIIANKMDLPESRANLEAFERAVQSTVWPISCASGAGIPALLQAVWQALYQNRASEIYE